MLLGIERAVVEDVRVELETIVVSVRPKAREKHRCGVCGRRCPREDSGQGRRRWRALDLGTTLAYLEADAPRVYCKHHRVVVAAVPWARHDSRFTVSLTEHGNRLVERLLSIRETCRLQGQRLHDYPTAAITADLHGQPVPTPLPP